MIDNIIYKNHLGEVLELGKNGIFANYNDLRDFSWSYSEKNSKISSFRKGIVSKALPIVICADDNQKAMDLKNKLFEIAEKDVLAKEYGRIYIGEYYLQCYVVASKKSKYLESTKTFNDTLQIMTDEPMWVHEKKFTFTELGTGTASSGLDYPYDYQFDFTNNLVNQQIVNDEISAADFELIIYGSCTNPSIIISGHRYEVDTSLLVGEYLVINSKTRKITKVLNSGQRVNCFNDRLRSSDVFQKIDTGASDVTWSGFGFDITLLMERGEPKWI